MDISVINWNMGGGKFLKLKSEQRDAFMASLNQALAELCVKHRPDIVCLQEVTRYRRVGGEVVDLISPPPGYYYKMVPLVDTENNSHPVRWSKYKKAGNWADEDYIGQGSGFLWRVDLAHASVWDFEEGTCSDDLEVENVPVETGLFTGDRDTEPRSAVLAHFIIQSSDKQLIYDIYLANNHLTTLKGEREGIPDIDRIGSAVRCKQVNTLLHGIVSRHVVWSQELKGIDDDRQSLYLLCGDFNAAQRSAEIQMVLNAGFRDVCPDKGLGNKACGLGSPPSHTVDYVFVYYVERRQDIEERFLSTVGRNPAPDLEFKVSDHFPVVAVLPVG
ncbi:MAG: endonuclease/exonuclease/phosphatase family protein [Desulfobulbaceae bacterium]|nr:endonuclease/exonuclease/phosphatase family protein [Desulfobulbaceae bacterium]